MSKAQPTGGPDPRTIGFAVYLIRRNGSAKRIVANAETFPRAERLAREALATAPRTVTHAEVRSRPSGQVDRVERERGAS